MLKPPVMMHAVARFGCFELDLRTHELRNRGIRLRLRQQPAEILAMLLERPGEVVSREEIRRRLWPDGTVVEFEHSINSAVNRLREVLGDSPDRPRYVETLPRRGYRFLAAVELAGATPAGAAGPSDSRAEQPEANAIRNPGETVGALADAIPLPVGVSRTRRLWRWLIQPVAAALVILAVAGLLSIGPRERNSAVRRVQMTTSRGLDFGARFSPDGKAFVYCSNRSKRFQLYRRQIGADSLETEITHNDEQNLHPAWSPDGAWIAYYALSRGIRVIAATGGTPRRLTDFGSDPAWSPDGRWIAFCSTEPLAFTWLAGSIAQSSTIWVVAADGSRLHRVTTEGTPRGPHSMPEWTPDGRSIVFVGGGAIWSVDVTSGKCEKLVIPGRDLVLAGGRQARLANPCFSPSGGGLYFSAATPDGEYALYCLPRRGERPRVIHTTAHELPDGIGFSPDGKRLLFTAMSHMSRLAMVKPGAEPTPLFQEAVIRVSLPSFSPDGKHLAFSVEAAGRNRELWIANADGSAPRRVSGDPGGQGSGLTWNRQGNLLYRYSEGSRMEFRRYDPEHQTTSVVFVRPAPPTVFYPLLLPDERELISSCSTPENICLTPVDGGEPRELTHYKDGATFPFVSHDGEWVVHNVRRGDAVQIGLTDRLGRTQEILTEDPGIHFAYSFSSDNRRIAYAAYREGAWNIWWIDRITRERRQLTHYTGFGSFVRSPGWRPGTEEVVYEQSEPKGNVYMLVLR